MSGIYLPILSRVIVSPLYCIYQWGKLKTRIVIEAQGAALTNLFYCRPYSSFHKYPVYQPLGYITGQVESVMYRLNYILLGCLGQD
jgi:hypothetical protein